MRGVKCTPDVTPENLSAKESSASVDVPCTGNTANAPSIATTQTATPDNTDIRPIISHPQWSSNGTSVPPFCKTRTACCPMSGFGWKPTVRRLRGAALGKHGHIATVAAWLPCRTLHVSNTPRTSSACLLASPYSDSAPNRNKCHQRLQIAVVRRSSHHGPSRQRQSAQQQDHASCRACLWVLLCVIGRGEMMFSMHVPTRWP